ncbi:hypothetical protein KBD59_01515 [Candidatus Gracilibacteria bacterium]|nr:hypothetical protein [Candidatus Gracilibacteria bacterium]
MDFSAFDLVTVGTLILLEGILSVDNALVLAILVRVLPKEQQRKALTYGLVGAIVFRVLALLFAVFLLKFTIIKLLGGVYLIYLSLKHLFLGYLEHEKKPTEANASNFWRIVLAVELTDIVFSIDSVTTAIAFSNKLWILWVGGIAGIIAMRFTSSVFVRLLEKYPRMEDLAYQLVFFVGTKLSFEVFGLELEKGVFWMMMGVIGIIGGSLIYREHKVVQQRKKQTSELIDQLQNGEVSIKSLLEDEKVTAEVYRHLIREHFLKEQK